MTQNADPVRLWTDLRERLCHAHDELGVLTNKAAASHAMSEYSRLDGKREGVRLALSYVDEYLQEML